MKNLVMWLDYYLLPKLHLLVLPHIYAKLMARSYLPDKYVEDYGKVSFENSIRNKNRDSTPSDVAPIWLSCNLYYGSRFWIGLFETIWLARDYCKTSAVSFIAWLVVIELPIAYSATLALHGAVGLIWHLDNNQSHLWTLVSGTIQVTILALATRWFSKKILTIGASKVVGIGQALRRNDVRVYSALQAIFVVLLLVASNSFIHLMTLYSPSEGAGLSAAFLSCAYDCFVPSLSVSLSPFSFFFVMSMFATWMGIFLFNRQLVDLFWINIPRYVDLEILRTNSIGQKLDTTFFAGYENYVLDKCQLDRIKTLHETVCLPFDIKALPEQANLRTGSALSFAARETLWSLARLSVLRLLKGWRVPSPAGTYHPPNNNEKSHSTSSEEALWSFVFKLHSSQLRLFAFLAAAIFASVALHKLTTASLDIIGEMRPAAIIGGHGITGTDANVSISISQDFKNKIKNSAPIVFAGLVIAWAVASIVIRKHQIWHLVQWDSSLVSRLPFVGHFWYLSKPTKNSHLTESRWDFFDPAIDDDAIGRFSPETEKILHLVDAVFVVATIEFLHLWH